LAQCAVVKALLARRSPPTLVGLVTTVALCAGACRSQPPDPTTGPQSSQKSAAPPPSAPASAAQAAADAAAAVASATPDAGPAPEETLEGQTFTKEVLAAFRVAACGGDDAWIPANIERKVVDSHCQMLLPAFAEYKKEWLEVAMPFIAKLRPPNLPATVVYPFGGGDLVSAIATYPDLTEITTISLEIAGDVRPVLKADNRRLEKELSVLREHLGKLFLKAHSRTVNLDIETRGAIPGEVAFTMAALAIHGYEPITLRYFDFDTDGNLVFYKDEDFTKYDKAKAGKNPFSNAEIRFRKKGDSKVKILRHVAFDLSDGSLRRSPALLKHLDKKGKVSTMTKAASHLLWDDKNFSVIREWLMQHTDWMISDTTGVPPRIAKKYGFVQDVYGQYEWPEPFGTVNNQDAQAFHDLFKNAQPITFRYGYPDNKSHGHIVVTRKN
jgi:hypothetical protein